METHTWYVLGERTIAWIIWYYLFVGKSCNFQLLCNILDVIALLMHREELWQFQTPMICQYAGSMFWWLTGLTQYFGCNWKLKVKIKDEFDDLESMFLTCISISFSHFSVLLKILVPISLRLQQSVEEMLFISGSTNHLHCQHWTLRAMWKTLGISGFWSQKAS